jgi:lysophospholipase L1-like esterase
MVAFETPRRAIPFRFAFCLVITYAVAIAAVRQGGAQDAADLPGLVRLVLPTELPAVVGIESNIYFDNVMLAVNPANYAVDITCAKGKQQAQRWTLTPKAEDVGQHPLSIVIRDQENRIVARGSTTLRIVAADTHADRPLSVLMIGDSLTNASIYPQHFVELCKNPGNPRVTLIGSHGPGAKVVGGQGAAGNAAEGIAAEVRHEGYGGWTALRFATHFSAKKNDGDPRQRNSPFLYLGEDGKPKLDFARYCEVWSQGAVPNLVTVFLGPNDIFPLDDENLEAGIDTMIGHYDALLAMVRQAGPDIHFAAMLPVPPAATQDAFGANYASGQTRWQYKRNQHRLVERMIAHYGNRESEKVYVIPTHLNLDCALNYPAVTEVANSRSESQVTRLNNGVHPAASGYRQIADTLYAWIKANPFTTQAANR